MSVMDLWRAVQGLERRIEQLETHEEEDTMRIGDGANLDAFGRLRVSEPETMSEHSFEYNLEPNWFHAVTCNSGAIAHGGAPRRAEMSVSTGAPTAGTGTVTVATGANPKTATFTNNQAFSAGDLFTANGHIYYVISGATTSWSVNGAYSSAAGSSFTILGSTAILRQKQFNLYEKGKSQKIKLTFLMGAAVANVRRRAGYYDEYNGVFLEQTTSGVSIVRRSYRTGAVAETTYAQANWTEDTLLGTGGVSNPSELTLDLSKQQILVIDLQFLGAGRIRIGFVIGGSLIYVHEINHANVDGATPYWQTGSLPVTWEMQNTDTSAGATMYAVCMEVESEGGSANPNANQFSVPLTSTVSAGSGTRTFALAIRPAELFNSLPNRMSVIPDQVSALAGTNPILVEVFYNCTLTGGSWVTAGTGSGMEYNTGATISALGVRVGSFQVGSAAANRGSGSRSVRSQYPLVVDVFRANPTNLVVTVTGIGGASASLVSLDWEERR